MRNWILCFAATLLLLTQASPIKYEYESCISPLRRKAWHNLTPDEKLSYIAAEKCLMTLPSKLTLPGTRTRFDELQIIHVFQTEYAGIHWVGAFLPFHRYYLHAHETLLRTECNYTGAHPYWDESLDAGNFANSVLLDPVLGFGGNGVGDKHCIADGPFKDYVNAIGPGLTITDHCMTRNINECLSMGAKKEYVDDCVGKETYYDMWNCLEAAPHTAGHGGISGQMIDVFSSPGDPLFYLHHAWLDKQWTDWQAQKPDVRLTEMGGPNQGWNITMLLPTTPPNNGSCPPWPTFPGPNGFSNTPPGVGKKPFHKKDGDPAGETTLDHVLSTYGAIPNARIKDVMNVQGGYLCYRYD